MNNTPYFVENVKSCAATLNNASGTALASLLTPGAEGSRLHSLNITSDDTADRVIQLWVTIGGVDYLLGEVPVPLGAGSNGTAAAVNALAAMGSLRSDGVNPFLDLATGAVLKVKAKTAVTASKQIQLFGEYGDF